MRITLVSSALLVFSFLAYAGEAHVLSAEVEHRGDDFYRFSVTVEHNDENWQHFVKAWEVLDKEGNILGVRVLRHPHIDEQPFTRSHTIAIPENINQVTIRAYDLVHKFGGKELTLELNKEK